eukprot:149705_1
MRTYGFPDHNFAIILQTEQEYFINRETLRIPPGIALNRAFKENLFVILIGLATKTPTIVIGKPGSSKTLAMQTLQENLSYAQKNKHLTRLGFDDYWVEPFQCSKLTQAKAIQDNWECALYYEKTFQTDMEQISVIFFLDKVDLAEQSP